MRREIRYAKDGHQGVVRVSRKRLRVLDALLAAEKPLTGHEVAVRAEYRGEDFSLFMADLRDAQWVTTEPDVVPRLGTTGLYPLLYQLTNKGRVGSEILKAGHPRILTYRKKEASRDTRVLLTPARRRVLATMVAGGPRQSEHIADSAGVRLMAVDRFLRHLEAAGWLDAGGGWYKLTEQARREARVRTSW